MSEVAEAVCFICGKEFLKERYCNRHIKNTHKINSKGELIPEPSAVKFACAACGRKFSLKGTLRRHIDTVHNAARNPSETELECDQCDFKTVHRSNMKRHWLRIHQGGKTMPNKEFKCSICPAKYRALRNLKYHERKRHNLGVISQTKRSCPLCEYTSLAKSKEAIYEHFRTGHNIDLTWETHNFNSITEFKLWKKNIELESFSYYCKSFESKQQLHYVCHRSGNYVARGVNIRRLKSIGSCKINGFCPSAMKVNIESDSVNVFYLAVHVGHDTDPKYVRPSCGGLGGGRKYRRAVRGSKETKRSRLEKEDVHESAVIVAVIDENNIIANEVVVEESSVPELNNDTAIDNMATNAHSYNEDHDTPQSYNEDHDTMLYLEKVKLFQEFCNFEGFLQKNVISIEQINYVRGEIVKIVSDINASNSTLNMG